MISLPDVPDPYDVTIVTDENVTLVTATDEF